MIFTLPAVYIFMHVSYSIGILSSLFQRPGFMSDKIKLPAEKVTVKKVNLK